MDKAHEPDTANLAFPEPHYPPPDLIDDELAQLIAQRGLDQAKRRQKYCFMIFGVSLCLGFVCGLMNVSVLPILAAASLMCLGWALVLTIPVQDAYRRRQYDKVAKLLPNALWWTAFLSPISYFQYVQCDYIKLSMLLVQGRVSELEITSRFVWAMLERKPVTEGIPNNAMVANNLAVSLMLQEKYAAAANVFAAKISNKLQPNLKLLILNNLAFCQIKDKQVENAEATLSEAFKLTGAKQVKGISSRLKLVQALVQVERGDLTGAESSLDEALVLGKKDKTNMEFEGACTGVLARIRRKQGRLDESELHYKNAIDILSSADNPLHLCVAEYLHAYAQVKQELGDHEAAEKLIERARHYYDYYVAREVSTVAEIRQRLMNPRPLGSSAELLTVADHIPLLELHE